MKSIQDGLVINYQPNLHTTNKQKHFMNDLAFITAIKNNEPEAFRDLVLNHQDMVINTCFGMLNNLADAEDVAQEVFMEVHRSIHKFRADAKLSTWLYRIAVNKSIDLIRKNKRKSWVSSIQSMFGGVEKEVDFEDKYQASAQDQLENEERRVILQNAIQTLPDNQRIAFTLHKFEELSYKEIANVMEVSLSSVESLMHRAKRNLKKRLSKYYHAEMKE
jgi:RNA polymerase sigma-70 factor (ECF subfamily)